MLFSLSGVSLGESKHIVVLLWERMKIDCRLINQRPLNYLTLQASSETRKHRGNIKIYSLATLSAEKLYRNLAHHQSVTIHQGFKDLCE